MPKRWERELRRLNDLDAPTGKLRARASEPPRGDGGMSLPPTRQRVVAGVVAFGVFIAAGTFLVRAIGPAEMQRGTASDTSLPALEVSMLSDGVIDDGSDEPPTKVVYSAHYGDVQVEDFTSTTSPGAIVDYVSVDDLGAMFPAPVAGSAVSITSDGEEARATIGSLSDWPNFERFESVEALPEPGRYVLTFEAVYPDGIARTSHLVDIVARGTVQITSAEGGSERSTEATVVIDGAATPGILREGSFHYSDVITGWPPERPPDEPIFIEVPAGASIVLGGGPSEQRLRLSPEPPPWDDGVGTRLQPGPLDAVEPGKYLLNYDVAWKHGRVAWDAEGTLESARFVFPIEIVDELASVVDASEAAAAPILESLPPRSFDGPTLHGKALDPADFDDRAIVAVAWSPSCVACSRVLGRIQNTFVSSKLLPMVVGVVSRSDRARAIEVEEVLSLTFESVVDRTDQLEDLTLPSTWVMKPDGSVVAYVAGHVDAAWLAASIADATFGEPRATLEGSTGEGPASISEPASDVLRVRCTESGAEVLTPTVETSANGVRVIATPGSERHADVIGIRPVGWPVFGVYSGSSGIDGEFVRAVPEGEVIVGCYREDVEDGRMTPDPRVGEATVHVLDTNDHFTPWIPSCPLQQQVAFDAGNRVELPGVRGADAVRALISAIRLSDEVVPASYGSARWEQSFFSVFRDGDVVGSVWIDAERDGTTRVSSGFACSGSGIEEGFETYPAWEGQD
jgi:hypothetical protein